MTTLDQVMTQNPVFGKTTAQNFFKRIDIIDALADKRAFREDILINIGNHARIRVDPRLASPQARIPGLSRAGQAFGQPGLQDAVAGVNDFLRFVKTGTVQRMGHRPDEFFRGIAGQLRIRIQGNDVLHIG